MRQFALVDSSNNRFELTIARASFFNQPTGLGFARDNEYVRVGGAYVRSSRDTFEQGEISGRIIMKGYALYPYLTAYLLSGKELRLEYTDGENGQTYYRDVEVQTLEKSELDTAGLLICPITFTCKSRWYQVIETTFTDRKDLLVANNGLLPAPWRLTVDVTNGETVPGQTIELYENRNGQHITLTKISVDKTNRRGRLIWDTRDGHARCVWNGENMVPVMDFTVDNFFKIPVGEYHFSVYGFSGGRTSGTIEIFKEWETV